MGRCLATLAFLAVLVPIGVSAQTQDDIAERDRLAAAQALTTEEWEAAYEPVHPERERLIARIGAQFAKRGPEPPPTAAPTSQQTPAPTPAATPPPTPAPTPGTRPPEPTRVFPNDHVLEGWDGEGVTCHWYPHHNGRNTTWFLIMLVTVTADEPRPWERWGSVDYQWRATVGGHEVSSAIKERWLYEGAFPDGGRTLEFYFELPVFGHYESESRVADYRAHQSGGEVPLVWYLLDGGERTRIDEPDRGSGGCSLIYDSLLTRDQQFSRRGALNVCTGGSSRKRDECMAEVRSDDSYLDISRWDGSNVCGYGRCPRTDSPAGVSTSP